MKLLLTTGHHTQGRGDQWKYDKASVILIDWNNKKVLHEFDYISPSSQSAKAGHMLFAHGHLLRDRLIVPTATEILTINISGWQIENVISHPYFNDIHHVTVIGDSLYVCNTGLQAVHRLSLQGELLDTYSTDGKPTWDTYDPRKDYRPLSTRPHAIHPNYIFAHNGCVFVTRCHVRDAVQIDAHDKQLSIEIGQPHDGIVSGGVAYFTTTNGHIVGMDIASRQRVFHMDLNQVEKCDRQLGWCRGLLLMNDGLAIVGFSQFRRSKSKEFIKWILQDPRGYLPSRLVLYDLRNRRRLDDMTFAGKFEGMSIYSVLEYDGVC